MSARQPATDKERGLLKLAGRRKCQLANAERCILLANRHLLSAAGIEEALKYAEETEQSAKVPIMSHKGLYTNKKGETFEAEFNDNGAYIGRWKGEAHKVMTWRVVSVQDKDNWHLGDDNRFYWIGAVQPPSPRWAILGDDVYENDDD
jgi:hypothetical protein